MITKEEFIKAISNYEKFRDGLIRIEKAISGSGGGHTDLFGCDWCDAVSILLETFVYSHFTEKGADWIFYYLYETIEDKKVTVKIEKDIFEEEKLIEYHLNSVEALWEFLQTDVNFYFKK